MGFIAFVNKKFYELHRSAITHIETNLCIFCIIRVTILSNIIFNFSPQLSILLQTVIFSSVRTSVRYLFLLKSWMYSFLSLMIKCKGFSLFHVTHPMQYIRIFLYEFKSILMLSRLKSLILIMSSKNYYARF